MTHVKAISLFSGGLDSILATKVIQNQGIEVIAFNVKTPFGIPKKDGVSEAEAAIKQLQNEEGLEETGILTGDTTYALMDRLREKIEKEDPQLIKAKDLLLEGLAK